MPAFEQLKDIVVEQLGAPAEKVTETASFQDDLGADSLDLVELIMAVEEKFGVEIADDKAQAFNTVGDVLNFLKTAGHA
ncbi:MAG: acyl carrier protein [bacterium]